MRVALGTNNEKEECTFLLLVAAGSLAEEPHEAGMAHLLELLVFRANSIGERSLYDYLVESIYGDKMVINGVTSTGMTMYSITLKQCYREVPIVKLLADIAYRTSISQEDLEKELRIVDAEEMQLFHGQLLHENRSSMVAFNRLRNFMPRAGLTPLFPTRLVQSACAIASILKIGRAHV